MHCLVYLLKRLPDPRLLHPSPTHTGRLPKQPQASPLLLKSTLDASLLGLEPANPRQEPRSDRRPRHVAGPAPPCGRHGASRPVVNSCVRYGGKTFERRWFGDVLSLFIYNELEAKSGLLITAPMRHVDLSN